MRTTVTQSAGGKINSSGGIISSGSIAFTAQRTAVGNYVIKFPGRRLISLNANPGDGVSVLCQVFDNAPDAKTVQVLNSGFAAVDASVIFSAVLAI
jgi:hypothetical protein